jgi:hypothetical protein
MTTLSEVAKYRRNPTKVGSILADISWRLAGNPLEQPWDRQKILSYLPAAFDCFCKRGYWKRLWVIQEFAVARNLTIICGNRKVSFDTFDAAWWYLYHLPERMGNIKTDSSVAEILEIAKACKSSAESFVSGIVTRRRRYRAGQGEKQDPLFSVMIVNLTLEADYNQPLASDHRDRVFSLMGLAGDRKEFTQFPNYTKKYRRHLRRADHGIPPTGIY